MTGMPDGKAMTGQEAPWRLTAALLAALFVMLLLIYLESFVSMVEIWWRSETFAHGFIILPICGYLVWKRRGELARLSPRPSLWGILTLALLVLAWAVSRVASILVLEQLMVTAMLPALLWALCGGQVVRILAFPLAYLFFAVPMGEALVPHLQDITADIVVRALRLTDMPVLREGRFITIPSGSFEVAEACSGIRYLIASLALGTLYAYFSYRSQWRRAAFIGLSLLVPVVANGLRAYGIIMLADLSNYRLAMGVDHIIYGWIFFGVVIALLFWIGSWFRQDQAVESAASALVPTLRSVSLERQLTASLAVVLLMFGGQAAGTYLERDTPLPRHAMEMPRPGGGWQGPFPPSGQNWHPVFHGASMEKMVEYRKGSDRVQLYVALYARQSQGAELINSQNQFYSADRWRRISEGLFATRDGVGRRFEVRRLTLAATGRERTVWAWYEVGGAPVVNAFEAKARFVFERLRGRDGLSLAILLSHEHDAFEKGQDPVLRDFVSGVTLPLGDHLLKGDGVD